MCVVLVRGDRSQTKQRERDSVDREMLSSQSMAAAERTLFHGIKWRHLDSVARSNVDWRITGFSHGVMFGQGKAPRCVHAININ